VGLGIVWLCGLVWFGLVGWLGDWGGRLRRTEAANGMMELVIDTHTQQLASRGRTSCMVHVVPVDNRYLGKKPGGTLGTT